MAQNEIILKPSDKLFSEGDQSKSLYLLLKGSIRVYKVKGATTIEIVTIRPGQLIGELAFLDGDPRSASAEAITDCTLIEITKGTFDAVLEKTPSWLLLLIRTISGRLRVATNKIRMLENATMEYETDKHGNRSREFVFVSMSELMRFCTALLTVASRYGKNSTTDGIEISNSLLETFSSQILQVSPSKVFSLIELFKTIEILKGDLLLTDIRFIDQAIQYLNEQNLIEPNKKRILTERALDTLKVIVQNHAQAQAVKENIFKQNVAPSIKANLISGIFLQELLDQTVLISNQVISGSEMIVEYDFTKLIFDYRVFSLLSEIDKLNEQKRKAK